LNPTSEWNLADGSKTVWDVRKLQALAWRQEAWELSGDLWRDVAHCCKHAYPAMLDFHGPTTFERLLIPILGESNWVEESHGCLDPKFVLESPQRRVYIVFPIPPCRSCQSILEKHADDGHHRKSSICKLCIQFSFESFWIRAGDGLESKITRCAIVLVRPRTHARDLAIRAICENLNPAGSWYF